MIHDKEIMMLKIIIQKEISGVLSSFRFHILLIITLLIFLLGGLLHVSTISTRNKDYISQHNKQLSTLQQKSSSLNQLAVQNQYLSRKPRAAELISINGELGLPDHIYFNAFLIGGSRIKSGVRYHIFSNTDSSNYKLNSFDIFDWTFIAGVIISFFILVLTYDAFSGEKQSGTLKMQCAYPVSRLTLFFSKYLAYLITISLVFILGIIISLITVKLASGFQLEIPSAPQLLGIFCAYIIYFSLFILLGLWFSSRSGQPATSLVYSLFTWMLLIFFLPSAMDMLGDKIRPIPSSSDFRDELNAAQSQIFENAPRKAQSYGPPRAFGGKVYPYMDLRQKMINEIDGVTNDFSIRGFQDMYRQAKEGANLGKISPYVLLRSIAERIAGNGLEALNNNFNKVVIQRNIMREFIEAKDRNDSESFHFVNSWHPETYSSNPVNYNEIPVIEDARPKLASAIKDSFFDLGLLIFFNMILLLEGWRGFLKYDVR